MKNLFRALAFVCVLSSFAGTAGAQSATTAPVCPLLGQYAFLFSGNFAISPVGRVGEFSVNSHGSVTGGTEDVYDLTSAHLPITSGRCTSGANGLDTLTLTAGGRTITYKFVVTKSGNARMVEFDANCLTSNCPYDVTYGTGIIRKQDKTAFSLAKLAGDWAFRFSGTAAGTAAEIGRLTVIPSGSGASLGNSVVQVDGYPQSLSLAAPSGITGLDSVTGRGAATETLDFSGAPQTFNFAFYVVSANELWFLETDQPWHLVFLLGEQVRQVGAGHFGLASLNSGSVFSLTGFDQSPNGQGNVISVGQVVADGKGNLSGEMDWNNDGLMFFAIPLSGTYTISPDGFGSATLSNGAWWLVMISPNTAYLLGQDYFMSAGQLEPQSKVLSVQGSYASGTVPMPISDVFETPPSGFQGVTNLVGIATFSAGTLKETLDVDTNAALQSNVSISGAYTLTGGRVVLPAADGGSPSIGYVISPTKFVTISSTNTDAALVRFEQ